ncbi:MAG: YifB family Mg chelatase-like AAA ATPase [Magnetococcales bacterium]|nr:YifB family Mg chelatase-like AAA ATPase [Magnetococcales bacterium]
MLASVNTVSLEGISAHPVEIEVDLSRGLPSLNLSGLPEATVREAKDRIRAALQNSGFQIPARRITINLAPADIPKEGSGYDLPMAIGLLAAMERIPRETLASRYFIGELALDGRIKPVAGCLPAALHARWSGAEELIAPPGNGVEAALVPGLRVVAPETLRDLVLHLSQERRLSPIPPTDWSLWLGQTAEGVRDLGEVKGQEYAKRALEIVAAGGHNLIMTGPPGSGKTLMARCLPGILPPLSLEEALEVTAIHSVAGRLDDKQPLVGCRPFRSPHHTASRVALIGGGSSPRPGEVSLAHRGVLFLDEIPEFGRPTLEVLREPMEAGQVTISRAARSANFPARFQLIAACNPCPCGHYGSTTQRCQCSPAEISRYRARLSGPLLDRIDIHLEVPPVPPHELINLPMGDGSQVVRERVTAAWKRQYVRNGPGRLNTTLEGAELDRHAALDDAGKGLLLQAGRRLGFSARAHHRMLRVARTIADLAGAPRIDTAHLAEAIQFRVGEGLSSAA